MNEIGIVTLHGCNYGSLLQCYALELKLKELGYSPFVAEAHYDVVDHLKKYTSFLATCVFHPTKIFDYWTVLRHISKKDVPLQQKKCMKKFESSLQIKKLSYREWCDEAVKSDYRCFICGSDQIWSNIGMRLEPFNFLQFAPSQKRIAYAPSFGSSNVKAYEKKILTNYLKGYQALSVREKTGSNIVEESIGIRVPVLLDPSLLLNKEEWKKISGWRSDGRKAEKVIVLYFLDEPQEKFLDIIKSVCIGNCSVELWGGSSVLKSEIKAVNVKYGDPLAFVRSIMNADLVMTDSYHAMLFSVNFNVNFWIFDRNYGHNYNQNSRIMDFLSNIGLINRYISCPADIMLSDPIDYKIANDYLFDMRRRSIEFLGESINSAT